jgi:hypothetical protein
MSARQEVKCEGDGTYCVTLNVELLGTSTRTASIIICGFRFGSGRPGVTCSLEEQFSAVGVCVVARSYRGI